LSCRQRLGIEDEGQPVRVGPSLLAVAVLCLSFIGACGRPIPSPVDIIPAEAVSVLNLQWQQVRSDALLRSIGTNGPVIRLLDLSRAPVDSIQSITLFSTALGSETDTAILVAPGWSRRIIERLIAEGWRRDEAEVLSCVDEHGTTITALNNSVAIVGSKWSTRRVMETAQDPRGGLARTAGGAVASALHSHDPVVMALVWPQAVRDGSATALAFAAGSLRILGFSPAASIVERMGIGRSATVRYSREQGAVRMRLAVLMQSEQGAKIASGSLGLLKGLSGLVPTDQITRSDLATGVMSMTIERDGPMVSVGMLLSGRDLRR
jgi:hypothetical protein